LVIGIWLLTGYKLRWACWVQVIVILAYTAVLSIIAPAYWLHPFGPVTKNIPLLVLIYSLSVSSPATGTSDHSRSAAKSVERARALFMPGAVYDYHAKR